MTETTYILNVVAAPGRADNVANFFRDLEPSLRDAQGFKSRQIYQCRVGAMAQSINKHFLGKDAESIEVPLEDDKGTQFVVIEKWESIQDRMAFSKNLNAGRNNDLKANLLPQHSHEFFENISVA